MIFLSQIIPYNLCDDFSQLLREQKRLKRKTRSEEQRQKCDFRKDGDKTRLKLKDTVAWVSLGQQFLIF